MQNFSDVDAIVVDLSCGFLYGVCEVDRVDPEHRRLLSLEVDSHELLPSLLLEMGADVGQRLFDDGGLDVDESFLQDWLADEGEVLGSSD